MSITILLADDHVPFRQCLRHSFQGCSDLEVVAEASSGEEAVQLACRHHPDVAILDIRMAPLNGIEAIPKILRESPETAILILSMHGDKGYVTRSVAAGASGYVLKDSGDEVLVRAVRVVSKGKKFFSPQVAQCLPAPSRATSPAEP